jgi:lysophospholipase L1-like esterase
MSRVSPVALISSMRWSTWAGSIAPTVEEVVVLPSHDPHAAARLAANEIYRPDRLVVCVGDSITRGQVSADYASLLVRGLGPRGFQFANAGVNGDQAASLLNRIDEVVARKPDVITLLIGTNDVRGATGANIDEQYVMVMDALLTKLRVESDARIAVLDIPMLGEEPGSELNERARAYNQALRNLAAAHGVPCLPLHERLAALLPVHHRPPRFAFSTRRTIRAALTHTVLRRSRDEIAHPNGLAVLTDHIHLTERGAAAAAELIGGFLAEPDR